MIGKFLEFLANDIATNPKAMGSISPDLVNYLQSILADVDVDLDSPLAREDPTVPK